MSHRHLPETESEPPTPSRSRFRSRGCCRPGSAGGGSSTACSSRHGRSARWSSSACPRGSGSSAHHRSHHAPRSDSRVIPESIFSAGIGDLFVIRLAGNVIDDHQLGSIEYAAGHLGCRLIVVLGHNHCGAVDAAMNSDPDGYIKFITDEIKRAIGDEKDEYKACCLNVKQSIAMIEHSLEIHKVEEEIGLKVIGAVYHLENGRVDFLE